MLVRSQEGAGKAKRSPCGDRLSHYFFAASGFLAASPPPLSPPPPPPLPHVGRPRGVAAFAGARILILGPLQVARVVDHDGDVALGGATQIGIRDARLVAPDVLAPLVTGRRHGHRAPVGQANGRNLGCRNTLAARQPIVDPRLDDLALNALQRLRDRRRRALIARHGDDQAAIGLALVELQEAEHVGVLVRAQAFGIGRHLHVQGLDPGIEVDGVALLWIVEPHCRHIIEPLSAVACRQREHGRCRQHQDTPAKSGALPARLGMLSAPHGFTPLSG